MVKKRLVLKKPIRKFLNKLLITILVFLIGMILVRSNGSYKNFIISNVYETNLKFTKFRNIYQKYFGKTLSIDKFIKEENPVFNEKLSYNRQNVYKDGVKLSVSDNYMVPVLESGIVIFIGEKEGYGETVVIEQIDGVDVFYSNVKISGLRLYDYVEKGKLLGEVIDNKLYLVFQKDGKVLDYKKYI